MRFITFVIHFLINYRKSDNLSKDLINQNQKASKHLSFEIDLLRPYDIKTLGNIY